MTAVTEALRLELTSLSVTAVTVNIGAVKTNGLASGVTSTFRVRRDTRASKKK